MAARERRLIIIAGPTASGKSALALALAMRLGGTIINADAMQCYRDLAVITARPSPADEAAAPHRLYGVRAADQPANAAWWRAAALAEMEAASLPILCGGTGMYLAALLRGIADIPDPGPEARTEARALLADIGPEALHQRLDAETAAKLFPTDSQRIARAYEVLRGWPGGRPAPPPHWPAGRRAWCCWIRRAPPCAMPSPPASPRCWRPAHWTR
jgi:tRNA dimethylallyltransferase